MKGAAGNRVAGKTGNTPDRFSLQENLVICWWKLVPWFHVEHLHGFCIDWTGGFHVEP